MWGVPTLWLPTSSNCKSQKISRNSSSLLKARSRAPTQVYIPPQLKSNKQIALLALHEWLRPLSNTLAFRLAHFRLTPSTVSRPRQHLGIVEFRSLLGNQSELANKKKTAGLSVVSVEPDTVLILNQFLHLSLLD